MNITIWRRMRPAYRRGLTALLLGGMVVSLAGCDIDWLEVFDPGEGDNGQGSDATAPVADTDVPGLNLAVSDFDFASTFDALARNIDSRLPYRRFSVDFQNRADATGPDIRPTRVVFYYNANLMTPLIAADPRAGLDLPPAVLVYQTDDDDTTLTPETNTGLGATTPTTDDDANVGIAYNAADYLAARYDLDAVDDALDAYEDDLSRLAANTAGNSVSVTGATDGINEGEGIAEQNSDNDFQATVNNLTQAIDGRADVVLLAQFDHRAAAQSVGAMLTDNNDPAILFVIDATDIVSRLIAGGQTVAVDLPIRVLVSQNEAGDVTIYHDTADYLADRHDLSDVDGATDDLRELLDDLVDQAAGTNASSGIAPGIGLGNGASNGPGISPGIDSSITPGAGSGIGAGFSSGIASGTSPGVSS